MKRAIILDSFPGEPLNEQHQAWCRANNLDPHHLPVAHPVLVDYDEKTITATVFISNEDGTKTMNEGRDGGYLKATRTVPLLSAPEDHNL